MKRFFLLCLFLIGLGWAVSGFSGLAAQGTYDSIVLDFREEIGQQSITNQIQAIAQKYQVIPYLNSEFSPEDNIYIVRGDKQLLKSLRKSLGKKTEYIEPNYIYSANYSAKFDNGVLYDAVPSKKNISQDSFFSNSVPNDPFYGQQWNLRSINVETAWNETHGEGVTVAVIDTGVSQVPDLKDTEFVGGYDFVNDRAEASDDNGHGTHVAGTVAQSTNNGYGVAGVAYNAKIMPLKVLSAGGGGTIADIAEAIKFAADNGADVINMSLGGGGESQLMQEAINYAYNKGVVIVAAAGNSGQNAAGYPARYPKVIGVAALDPTGNKTPYSNFGAGVDIAAPGGLTEGENTAGGILQETIDPETGGSTFAAFQGTSMASPHVAAIAALVKASGITEPEDVAHILKESARKVTEDPLNHFGAGHVDAGNAVQLALKGQITFRDFFRWLRDSGYLNPRFWIDGGAVALLPKLGMVLGSYLLAWFLRNYFPFQWSFSMMSGLVAGSSGLFFLRGFYIFDLPQWPMRMMGSSVPELGNAIAGNSLLNPIFASVLIPAILVVLFLGHSTWKWIAIGTTIGVASCLTVSAVISPAVWGLGSGILAQGFLGVNALLCLGLATLALKAETRTV
ncbi:S8 family peptidase [Lyngbya sp. PCC 8106]|uniref:S8 family peptidase n=1 Tax=Lyngbya sp. (strain PCC 8106) TaxID=313612 RepID=UPI0000EAC5A6|nr:S8 family peptidase [Lyngbya sp. PCC 8106]EAW38403.1 Peptidase S8 and S53, subtilisin, kexin, sedolisin [Lyngbya sp. PCC 8106]